MERSNRHPVDATGTSFQCLKPEVPAIQAKSRSNLWRCNLSVTLKDVAARAEVSPIVVSKVLHGKAKSIRVSTATAERVRQAAEDLNYKCNIVARNLRSQKTGVIGLLHGTGAVWPHFDKGSRYFASLMDGILQGAFESEYSVMLCPILLGKKPEDGMYDGRFDGLVWYCSTITPETEKIINDSPIPLVLIHTKSDRFTNRPSVICDNVQGIGLAIEHLMILGHTSIGFIAEGFIRSDEMQERRMAFLAQMKAHGLKATEEDILEVSVHQHEIDDYLKQGPCHTAVICSTEELAAQCIRRAPTHQVNIPHQLSVIGFDSTDYCNELRPALTAIYQPLKIIGRKAIHLLLDSIQGASPRADTLVIPCGLDIRESTSTPKLM